MPLLFKRSLLPKLRSFPLTAEAVTILSGAAEFRRCLLEKIAAATQRIYIVALYLQHDEAGQEILDALHAAKLKRPELEIVVVVQSPESNLDPAAMTEAYTGAGGMANSGRFDGLLQRAPALGSGNGELPVHVIVTQTDWPGQLLVEKLLALIGRQPVEGQSIPVKLVVRESSLRA